MTPTPVAPHMLPPLRPKARIIQLENVITDAICLLQWGKPEEALKVLSGALRAQQPEEESSR